MTDDLRQQAIALYDRYTHETHDRRAFIRELTMLAGGAAAAQAIALSIGADAASAALIAPTDKRLATRTLRWPAANGRTMGGYTARPAGPVTKRPAVIVIHENRGLTDHIRDVTRRVALAGFVAVAPDFLSVVGGTPVNEDEARTAIGKLDLAATVADGVATIGWLRRVAQSNGRVGVIGFCWGGAMVNRLATGAGTALGAGVAYYGPAPDPARARLVKAPLMLHYAGIDDRVNAGAGAWVAALEAAQVDVTRHDYPGANHAFNNDTSAERYDKAAADLAWGRTIAFLRAKLA